MRGGRAGREGAEAWRGWKTGRPSDDDRCGERAVTKSAEAERGRKTKSRTERFFRSPPDAVVFAGIGCRFSVRVKQRHIYLSLR